MSFGEVLKRLRTNSGLTQQQLADMISLSKANVSKYESNSVEPNLETLRLIAKVFDTNANELLEIGSNVTESKQSSAFFSITEEKMVKKYRLLDPYGQKAVDHMLDIEYERCAREKTKDKLVEIPYAARSNTGEHGTITKTQEEVDEFLKGLTPDSSEQY